MSDPQRPHGLQPSRLLGPWDFPGKSTGVGCHPRQLDVIMQRRTRDEFLAFWTEQRATETGMKLPDGNVEFVCFWLKHSYDGECWITPVGRFSLRVSSEDSHFPKSRSCFCPDGFTVPWTDLPSPIRTFLSTFMETNRILKPQQRISLCFSHAFRVLTCFSWFSNDAIWQFSSFLFEG